MAITRSGRVERSHQAGARRVLTRGVARRRKPYKIIFEAVTQEKKKLRSTVSYNSDSPPGYVFVPAGTPDLTERCKELCRTKGLKVFVVSAAPKNHASTDPDKISHHIHRIGYHFPNEVVDSACNWLGYTYDGQSYHRAADLANSSLARALENVRRRLNLPPNGNGQESAEQISASIRDLFPKIPEKDLTSIVKHAFREGTRRVGNADLPLPKRVQLAVLAHIRHMYTGYDKLLRSGSYIEARQRVEQTCLDKLMSWRGENEGNVIELEDTFRETIVIDSDSDDEADLTRSARALDANAGMVFRSRALEPNELVEDELYYTNRGPNPARDNRGRFFFVETEPRRHPTLLRAREPSVYRPANLQPVAVRPRSEFAIPLPLSQAERNRRPLVGQAVLRTPSPEYGTRPIFARPLRENDGHGVPRADYDLGPPTLHRMVPDEVSIMQLMMYWPVNGDKSMVHLIPARRPLPRPSFSMQLDGPVAYNSSFDRMERAVHYAPARPGERLSTARENDLVTHHYERSSRARLSRPPRQRSRSPSLPAGTIVQSIETDDTKNGSGTSTRRSREYTTQNRQIEIDELTHHRRQSWPPQQEQNLAIQLDSSHDREAYRRVMDARTIPENPRWTRRPDLVAYQSRNDIIDQQAQVLAPQLASSPIILPRMGASAPHEQSHRDHNRSQVQRLHVDAAVSQGIPTTRSMVTRQPVSFACHEGDPRIQRPIVRGDQALEDLDRLDDSDIKAVVIALIVRVEAVKTVKTALEKANLLDKSVRIQPAERATCHAAKAVEEKRVIRTLMHLQPLTENAATKEIILGLLNLRHLEDKVDIRSVPKRSKGMYRNRSNPLSKAIESWLRGIPLQSTGAWNSENLSGVVPSSYSLYAPMLLLPAGSFSRDMWKPLLASPESRNSFYGHIAKEMSVSHIAINARIPSSSVGHDKKNALRRPLHLSPVYGDFGPDLLDDQPNSNDFDEALWVTTSQNGVHQCWAPLYTMFSSGNVTEKARMLSLPSVQHAIAQGLEDGKGSTAIDLYAGIGYFAFSYAAAGITKVLCWELNAWSVEGLHRGAARNGWQIEDGPLVHEYATSKALAGPAKLLVYCESNVRASQRIKSLRSRLPPVRHVNCGLLPSSKESWKIALEILDPRQGGWIHVHENLVLVSAEDVARGITEHIRQLSDEVCRERESVVSFDVRLEHVEKVKTYAPGIHHCVLDISVNPGTRLTGEKENVVDDAATYGEQFELPLR